jgi:hypothetical protein
MGRSTNTALAALKIGGRVAYERLARPKARHFDDVPCSPYAVTAEWLTAVLCGKTPGAVVTGVEVKPASAGTHERHQLKVSYNEEGRRAGLPKSIFTKSLPSIVTRMIGGFNGTARAEGNFYTQIRPQLEIEAPLCYHSAYDRKTFAAIHLLEDMVATKSATFCNHETDVTRAMAEDMIDLLVPSTTPKRRSMLRPTLFRQVFLHAAPTSGRLRCVRLRCMTANRKDFFTPTCTSVTGIALVPAKWDCATGSAFRAVIGRAISPTP